LPSIIDYYVQQFCSSNQKRGDRGSPYLTPLLHLMFVYSTESTTK
jgi:hypothetical protein